MGSRTRDTMNEVDERRARLDATLKELEGRMPAVGSMGKKALGVVLGGGAGTSAAVFLAKKLFGRKRKHKAAEVPQVTVKLVPNGAVFAAVAIAAIWGVVKVVEAGTKAAARSGTVRELRSTQRPA